jgi:hypothetical protein
LDRAVSVLPGFDVGCSVITLHRKRERRERSEPTFSDLTLAYSAGFWTAALLALFLITIWR